MKSSNKINWKLILSVVMSGLIILTLIYQNYLDKINVLSLCLFIILICFIYKSNFGKKYRRLSKNLAFIFAILFLLGHTCYKFGYDSINSIWNELFDFRSVVYLGGYFSLFFVMFINLFPKICEVRVIDENMDNNKGIRYWLGASIAIFICYLPYFIIYYPGLFTHDSINELRQILGNFVNLSDHHTVVHILLSSLPFKLGMSIFHNVNVAASFVIIFQMIIMSLIFGSVIKFLYQRKVNKKVLLLVFLYFAVVPIHAFYSITMWKDVLFSGFVLLLTMELIKLLETEKITFRNSCSFVIVSIFTVFLRNNAIYMYAILAIISLFVFRKQLKAIIPMLLVVFLVYGGVKGPIFNYFGIERSSSREYIAVPLQQIGRMAYKEVKFTKEEADLINKIIPLETLKKVYNPEVVDSIKFSDKYNAIQFDKNKDKYLKLWVSLCVKHFDIALESHLISTLGYWYPNIDYWTVITRIDENDIGVHDSSKVPYNIKSQVDKLSTKKIPIYGFIWCIGICIWIIIIAIGMIFAKKDKRALYVFAPVFGIWLTMMVATPVFAEFRYIYSAYTCLPILLLANSLVSKHKYKNM